MSTFRLSRAGPGKVGDTGDSEHWYGVGGAAEEGYVRLWKAARRDPRIGRSRGLRGMSHALSQEEQCCALLLGD